MGRQAPHSRLRLDGSGSNNLVGEGPWTDHRQPLRTRRASLPSRPERDRLDRCRYRTFCRSRTRSLEGGPHNGSVDGQRVGDLRTVTWTAYDGEFIRLKQSKTGRRVAIRVGAPLKAVLDALPRRAVTILTTEKGTSWTHFGFQSSWRKAVVKVGPVDLHFLDLRG